MRSWKEILTKLQLLQSTATDWKFIKIITKNKNDYGGNIRSNDGKYLANTTDIWQILLTIVRSSRTQIFFKMCSIRLKACNFITKESDTGVFLWILRKFAPFIKPLWWLLLHRKTRTNPQLHLKGRSEGGGIELEPSPKLTLEIPNHINFH